MLLYEQWIEEYWAKALWGVALAEEMFNSPIREGNCLLIDRLKFI
jgi:hypothetical protein